MVAALLSLGARALPVLARVGPAITEGVGSLGTLARVVGAGARGAGGNATRATAQILRNENAVARVAGRRAAQTGNATGQLGLDLQGASSIPQKLGVTQSYAQAAEQMARNPFIDKAYSAGQVLNKVGQYAGPAGNVANMGLTAAFLAPMLMPQSTSQTEYATAPFDNAYTQLPTPSGAQMPTDPRMGEAVGGVQAAAMANDQGGAPYGLTDEQIVKAKRRAEETAQLNQLYASTLSNYQMPN